MRVILSFGANEAGSFGLPVACFSHVIGELNDWGLDIQEISSVYLSPSLGARHLAPYYNLVISGFTTFHPNRLMKKFKQLERASGRKGQVIWGSRPLDIDIIDFNGVIHNWLFCAHRLKNRKKYHRSKVRPLAYPHQDMHHRAFVLKPLAEILPTWRHPVFGLSAAHLMRLNCSPLVIRSTEKLDISLDL